MTENKDAQKNSKEIEELVKKREEWKKKKELRQGIAAFIASLAFFPAWIVVQLFTEYNTFSFWMGAFIFTIILGLPIYFLILWLWPEPKEPSF